jgi:hypothetical protein
MSKIGRVLSYSIRRNSDQWRPSSILLLIEACLLFERILAIRTSNFGNSRLHARMFSRSGREQGHPSVPAAKFSISCPLNPLQPAYFRSTKVRNPQCFNNLHTLQNRPSASHGFSRGCALFKKQPGVYPQKRNSGETIAAKSPVGSGFATMRSSRCALANEEHKQIRP